MYVAYVSVEGLVDLEPFLVCKFISKSLVWIKKIHGNIFSVGSIFWIVFWLGTIVGEVNLLQGKLCTH